MSRRYSLSACQPTDVRFISGHHIGRSLERLLPGRTLRRSVLLREPVSFMLSYYNYRMMRYIANGWKPYSFELHLRSLPHDPISHFILERWLEVPWPVLMVMSPRRKYEMICQELQHFWYVADYKYCDELIGLMGTELGIATIAARLNTKEEWTQKVDWRPLSVDDLSSSIRNEIAARTRLDQALWQSWKASRLAPSGVQPTRLDEPARFDFPIAEAQRPIHSFARRYQRGWF